jgi:hypothetical protein
MKAAPCARVKRCREKARLALALLDRSDLQPGASARPRTPVRHLGQRGQVVVEVDCDTVRTERRQLVGQLPGGGLVELGLGAEGGGQGYQACCPVRRHRVDAVGRRPPCATERAKLEPLHTSTVPAYAGSIAPSRPCTDCSVGPRHVCGPAVKNNLCDEPARPSLPNASDHRPLIAIRRPSVRRR